MPTGIIESLDHEARGVTRLEGKTVFVEGALPGELVEYASYRRKPAYELARTVALLQPSSDRVAPRCPHFGVCGGCSMQHLEPAAQVAAKQRLLEDNLWHIGRVRAEELYAPINGAPWGYRRRARLSVRFVAKKGGILVGFHERKSSYVADMRQCEILPAHLSALLLPLRDLIGGLSIRERLPQIEVAVGERITALVLRVLEPPTPADAERLREFADRHRIVFYLQPQGPATAYRFHPPAGEQPSYLLPDFAVEHPFSPTEFTQVNHAINRVWCDARWHSSRHAPVSASPTCSAVSATSACQSPARAPASSASKEDPDLVHRATENAAANDLAVRVEYRVANLFEMTPQSLAALGHFDRMLIDPPREGAVELIKSLPVDGPRRIVYVSCSPATLARDAAILVTQKGYRLRGAGVVNMFPQTSHVESIALFERHPAG
jgi:23S rRNA (uracil1939-C5)-methyltransferase